MMPPVGRRLLNVLTVLSLLLCVAACVLWASWHDGGRVGIRIGTWFRFGSDMYLLGNVGHELRLMSVSDFADSEPRLDWGVPYWLLVLATLALPAWRLLSMSRRPRSGHCP